MSSLVIHDLDQCDVLDSAAMQHIKGGFPTLVNLFHVYANPENYPESTVQIARDYIEGN